MKIDILTLFPEMFVPVTTSSILGRAAEKNLIDIRLTDIREYTKNKHRKVDDYPFGGGQGMVMMPQPIFDALRGIKAEGKKILYMSPRGRVLDKDKIQELSQLSELVILCGHYEGVDQRVIDCWEMEEVSIGDYILTGGGKAYTRSPVGRGLRNGGVGIFRAFRISPVYPAQRIRGYTGA